MTTTPENENEYEYDGYYLELSPDDFVVEGDRVVINDARLADATRAVRNRVRDSGGETMAIWIKR